jgi:chemotaxis protein histidine kinase CheA
MIDSSMLPDFIIEAREHLEELESSLLQLENNLEDRDVLNDIFRSMHTIKGAAQFVGIDRVAELSHRLENLLDMVRKQEELLNADMIDLLIAGKDRISQLVGELEHGQAEEAVIDDLLLQVKKFVAGDSPAVASGTEPALAPAVSGGQSFQPEEQGSSLHEDSMEEEYDDELYGIFMQQLKENIPFLHAQSAELETSVDRQDVLNRCNDSIKSLKSSANYMGYDKLTQHYTGWQNAIAAAVDQLAAGRMPDLSFMQSYIDEIIQAYPQVVVGEPAESGAADSADPPHDEGVVEALDSLFSDSPDSGIGEEDENDDIAGKDLDSALDTVFEDLSAETDSEDTALAEALDASLENALQEDMGSFTADPAAENSISALENESLGEDYDAELVEIFLRQLMLALPFLQSLIDELANSDKQENVLERCSVTVKNLASASNYMGYEQLTGHCTAWIDAIGTAVDRFAEGQQPDLHFMQTFLDAIVKAYPQTDAAKQPDLAAVTAEGAQLKVPQKSVTEKSEQTLPGQEKDVLAGEAGQTEFEDVTATIDSLLSTPSSAGKTAPVDEVSSKAVQETEPEPAARKPDKVAADGAEEEQELFDRLSNALDLSMEQTEDTLSEPMDSIIEKMIDRPDRKSDSTDSGQKELQAKKPVSAQPVEKTTAAKQPVRSKQPVPSLTVTENKKVSRSVPPKVVEKNGQQTDTAPVGEEGKAPEKAAETKVKQSMRVDADKIDFLMNQVGELVVSRAYFAQLFHEIKGMQQNLMENAGLTKSELKPLNEFAFRLGEAGVALGRVSNELQEGVMKVRMLPIDQLFKRYPRLVRDLVHKTSKEVILETKGEETELDKMVIEEISDPLIHIIRNAVDHGIETTSERKRLGKPEKGLLILEAYHESDHIVIEVSDDGRGLDTVRVKEKALAMGMLSRDELERMSQMELMYLVMQPGFSTADKTTKTSGRGVGMDVVKKNIEKLNGSVEIETKTGKGTRIRIKIPLTMAIIQSLRVRVGTEKFTIPLRAVEETLRVFRKDISVIEGVDVIHLRDITMPIFKLSKVFGIERLTQDREKFFVVVVRTGLQSVGLVVDELLGQEEVVIKPLADYLRLDSGFSGATILGNGGISLILDIPELLKMTTARQVKKQKMISRERRLPDTVTGRDQAFAPLIQ